MSYTVLNFHLQYFILLDICTIGRFLGCIICKIKLRLPHYVQIQSSQKINRSVRVPSKSIFFFNRLILHIIYTSIINSITVSHTSTRLSSQFCCCHYVADHSTHCIMGSSNTRAYNLSTKNHAMCIICNMLNTSHTTRDCQKLIKLKCLQIID